MATEEQVQEALRREELEPLGRIVLSKDEPETAFVTIAVARDASGKQQPSNASLHLTAKRLRLQGINVQFLLRYEQAEEIESGLRATVLHSHIDHVRNVFVSLSANEARIWIEPKHALSAETIREIEDRSQTFLALFDVQLTEILLTSEELLPSKLAILTTIRQLAPAPMTAIAAELLKRGLTVPSDDWLKRKLDLMRKDKDIVRLESGKYVLTRYTLHRLGTAKSFRSPDIARLLALARRGG
ncbi:MAG: hypothetical protein E6Q97_03760 [Desulfurellales bacterium]|nr:MAG: hypothetical protein E6Q97_03760 [Desulfurellales bacterium]